MGAVRAVQALAFLLALAMLHAGLGFLSLGVSAPPRAAPRAAVGRPADGRPTWDATTAWGLGAVVLSAHLGRRGVGRGQIPPVRMPMISTGSGAIDVMSKLLQDRVLMLNGQVNDEMANKDITIYINSPGGSVSAGMAIYDAMQFVPCDVSTVCYGMAASMGAIHQPLGGAGGQAADIEIQAKEILFLRDILNTYLSDFTGKPLAQVAEDCDRDYYMTPEEASEYGIIDEVIQTKTINTDLEDEGPGTPATPSIDPEVLLQPSLSKGMPFHNGFLYKLGDGILNNTWNLRYFLLIGQTLQYYRSQHEARPRDAIHLSGVTVEWLKDQSRPFTFAVSKSGSRSYCLSGWDRVSKGTDVWSQVLVQLLEHRGALRELRQGLRILEAPGAASLCFIARGVPVVAAAACVNVPVEEVKEALMEHWRFRDWQPDHLESLPLSLQPGRDEVLRLRCRTGIPGCHFSCELRRRWARSDGARLLLCVEEILGAHSEAVVMSEGEITSFEGFAIQPLDDGCLVVWLCGLDLAPTPWTPRAVREALAVRRVSALAGLREWLRCRRNGPKTSVSRMEQKLAGGFGRRAIRRPPRRGLSSAVRVGTHTGIATERPPALKDYLKGVS
eukprot:g2760.t1